MEERAFAMAQQHAPWRRGISWQVVGIQGVIIAAIGLYMLIDPKGSRDATRQLIAVIVLFQSLLQIVGAFRIAPHPMWRFHLPRAGIGLAVGTIVLLAPFNDYLTDSAARWILGFGLLAQGLITLVATVAARGERGLRGGGLLAAAVMIIVALLLMTSSEDSTTRARIFGGIALFVGAVLLAYAAFLRRSRETATSSGATTPV